jgi:hypothetical protein
MTSGSYYMDSEVNALMGAADEEHWDRAGLFTSVDTFVVVKATWAKLMGELIPTIYLGGVNLFSYHQH